MWAIRDNRNNTFISQPGHRVPALFSKQDIAETKLKILRRQAWFKDCEADALEVVAVRVVPEDAPLASISGTRVTIA